MLVGVAAIFLALDQVIKLAVSLFLVEGRPVPILGPVLQLLYVRNAGAAFSLISGATWLLTVVAVCVVVVIIVLARRITSRSWAGMFGLLLGGVLGNLTDRLFREPGFGQGHVVDYLATPWLIPAIYNLADMTILAGMSLFVVLTVRGIRLDGTRVARD